MKHHLIVIAAGLLAACTPPASTTANTATATTAPAIVQAADPSAIHVTAPAANAHVTSPLVTTGDAPANWFFEAQFYAELVGADGKTIAEAPATALEDWTNGKPAHPFRAVIPFSVAADTPATLVLREDMPPDADHPDVRVTQEFHIPVTLAAH